MTKKLASRESVACNEGSRSITEVLQDAASAGASIADYPPPASRAGLVALVTGLVAFLGIWIGT